ncbi:MAG: immunoglobulin domain-containing protein [Phycisphaerales bacterium]
MIVTSEIDQRLFRLPPGRFGVAVQGLTSDASRLYIAYDDTLTYDPNGHGHIDIVTESGTVLGSRQTPAGCWHPNDINFESATDSILAINFDDCPVNELPLEAWRISLLTGDSARLPAEPATPACWHLATAALDGSIVWRGIRSAGESRPNSRCQPWSCPVSQFELAAIDQNGQVLTTRHTTVDGFVQSSFVRDGFFWLFTSPDPRTDPGALPILTKFRLDIEPLRAVGSWVVSPPPEDTIGDFEGEGVTMFRDRLVYSAFISQPTGNAVYTLRSDLSDRTIALGEPASLYVAATGTSPLYFQWQRNGVDLTDGLAVSGAHTNSLTLDPMTPDLIGEYRCIVYNLCGSIVSSAATLSIPGSSCDSIDFNNDTSLFDPQDIESFLSVYSEGPCIPAYATCGDIDFNNDGSLFDPCDIDSFLLVFSEGPCVNCGI